MDHFGFLMNSSHMMNGLPDVTGTMYWTPFNDIAAGLSDRLPTDHTPQPTTLSRIQWSSRGTT